jgi:hypothetical protein
MINYKLGETGVLQLRAGRTISSLQRLVININIMHGRAQGARIM